MKYLACLLYYIIFLLLAFEYEFYCIIIHSLKPIGGMWMLYPGFFSDRQTSAPPALSSSLALLLHSQRLTIGIVYALLGTTPSGRSLRYCLRRQSFL